MAPATFHPGDDLALHIVPDRKTESAQLYYRHVNQAEHYKSLSMTTDDLGYHAVIPGDYTDSDYPLQYYFELRETPQTAWLYPGLGADLLGQPYFLVRRA
jgi:hypothetical protein